MQLHWMEVSGQPHALATLLHERAPSTYRTGRWVGHGSSLDILKTTKSLATAGVRTPDRPVRSLVTTLATVP
jgi:hypothetical protein